MGPFKQFVKRIQKVGARLRSETEEVTSGQSVISKRRVRNRTKSRNQDNNQRLQV